LRVFLDSSVVVRIVLREPDPLVNWNEWEEACCSAILDVEARRVIERLRLQKEYDDVRAASAHAELEAIELSPDRIGPTPEILRRAAGQMGVIVKTLDAIHLATALVRQDEIGSPLLFATHDRGQAVAARALGFEVVGV
jgi:predicted nucleic acid-binding protein